MCIDSHDRQRDNLLDNINWHAACVRDITTVKMYHQLSFSGADEYFI